MSNKFKNISGKFFTKALFLETSDWNRDTSIYTLNDDHKILDGKEYLSLGRLYVQLGDVEEFEFANKYLGGWKHWQQLQASPALKPFVDEWRKELHAKLKSMGASKMRELAEAGDRNAAKWFAEEGFKGGKLPKKPGRPSTKNTTKAELFTLQTDIEKAKRWQ